MRQIDKKEYHNIHQWAARSLVKTGSCSHCLLIKRTEWSNKTGNYVRDSRDWQELCRSCHYKYDVNILGKKPVTEYSKKGGSAKVAKGFALMSADKRREASKKGGSTPRKSSKTAIYKGVEYSQSELAIELGLSRQRISQMKKSGINRYGIVF